jgi:hypothetical protein
MWMRSDIAARSGLRDATVATAPPIANAAETQKRMIPPVLIPALPPFLATTFRPTTP